MAKTLTRGGVARVYRPGGGFGDCQGVYNVPEKGAFEIRDLPVGEYVARDEEGNEVAFTVEAGVEVAVVFGGPSRAPAGASAANPHPKTAPRLHGGRRPVPNLPHVGDPDAGELEGELAEKPEPAKKPARKAPVRKAPKKK